MCIAVANSYNDANQMNSDPLPDTQCIDTAVAPREKYFYVVRAVAADGVTFQTRRRRRFLFLNAKRSPLRCILSSYYSRNTELQS
jgi:hypothetical protein